MFRRRGEIGLIVVLAVTVGVVPGAAGATPGDLDPSFGIGGRVTTSIGLSARALAVVLQGNGKIVVGGSPVGCVERLRAGALRIRRHA